MEMAESIAFFRYVISSWKKIKNRGILYSNKGKELTILTAINMNNEMFEELGKEDKPVLVDYWAPWCGYCRRISAAYDKIAEEYGDTVVAGKINIDENPQLAETEQIEVIPTLVLYKHGKAIDSIVAPESKAMIERFLKGALEK